MNKSAKIKNIVDQDFAGILRRVNMRRFAGKKILVTGASGFLGQYIVGALSYANRLLGLNCRITAVGKSQPKALLKALLAADKRLAYKRVNLAGSFYLRGYDYIFHAAGYGQPAKFLHDPGAVVDINVNATRRLLEGSPLGTLVFFSAGSIYGDIPPVFKSVKENYNGDLALHETRSVYAEAKRLGEALCAAYRKNLGRQAKIVRISYVYGPGLGADDKRVMNEFMRSALTKKHIALRDAGESLKTYGYIADVVSMILFAASAGKEFVYNIGGRDGVTVLELAKKIAKLCGATYSTPAKSSPLAYIGKDLQLKPLDLGRITGEMKNFRFTPFQQGLRQTLAWTKIINS